MHPVIPGLLLAALLAGCASQAPVPSVERQAPVTVEKPLRSTGAPPAASTAPGGGGTLYTVKKGDTLYSIALDNGQDYKDLAAWNNLDNPNLIRIGQQLRVTPPGAPVEESGAVVKPIAGPAAVEVRPVESRPLESRPTAAANTEGLKREPRGGKEPYSEAALAKARESATRPEPAATVTPATGSATTATAPAAPPASTQVQSAAAPEGIDWSWPAAGKMMQPFSEGSNKGIDIAGKTGEPVQAAAAGKVVYAGTGLRGYGKLVIVRHNADFLSAYAHNHQILVKEGQAVTARQVIAEIGSTDADSPRLHFEIRRQGKPVDPLKYLPPR